MEINESPSLLDDFRRVVRDGIDYLASALGLLQARLTEYVLSTILFIFLLVFASLLLIAGFVFFNIAIGVALAHALNSVGWSLVILGSVYTLLSFAVGGIALRWVSRIKS
jgi:hypothetical protein